jgi:hypothetical protein
VESSFIGSDPQELMEWIMAKLPNAQVGEDNDGQIIIYTALQISDGETTVEAGKLQPIRED